MIILNNTTFKPEGAESNGMDSAPSGLNVVSESPNQSEMGVTTLSGTSNKF